MPTKVQARVPSRQKRPGGRSEQVRKQVARSALALIQSGQIDFSYNELAEASGVNKVTLYRRWPSRADLLKEALKEHDSVLRFPDSTQWPQSATALLRELAAFLGKPTEIAFHVALYSDRSAEATDLIYSQWEPFQQRIDQFARDAQAQGRLPPDIDAHMLMLMLVAPLFVLALWQRKAIDRDDLNKLIRIVQRMRFPEAP